MPWWLLWKRKVQGADVKRLEAWDLFEGPSLAGGDFRGARLTWVAELVMDVDRGGAGDRDHSPSHLYGHLNPHPVDAAPSWFTLSPMRSSQCSVAAKMAVVCTGYTRW